MPPIRSCNVFYKRMCGPEVFIEAVSGFESIDMYTERGRERVNEIRAARQERHGINMMPSVA